MIGDRGRWAAVAANVIPLAAAPGTIAPALGGDAPLHGQMVIALPIPLQHRVRAPLKFTMVNNDIVNGLVCGVIEEQTGAVIILIAPAQPEPHMPDDDIMRPADKPHPPVFWGGGLIALNLNAPRA